MKIYDGAGKRFRKTLVSSQFLLEKNSFRISGKREFLSFLAALLLLTYYYCCYPVTLLAHLPCDAKEKFPHYLLFRDSDQPRTRYSVAQKVPGVRFFQKRGPEWWDRVLRFALIREGWFNTVGKTLFFQNSQKRRLLCKPRPEAAFRKILCRSSLFLGPSRL